MNQNKRKTTTTQNSNSVKMRDVGSKRRTKKAADRDLKNGNCRYLPMTREYLARWAFKIEYMEDYFEKHPDVDRLPEDERRKMDEIFDQRVKTTHSKIVEDYHEKYPLDLFQYDPCFKVTFIEMYKKSKKAPSEMDPATFKEFKQ